MGSVPVISFERGFVVARPQRVAMFSSQFSVPKTLSPEGKVEVKQKRKGSPSMVDLLRRKHRYAGYIRPLTLDSGVGTCLPRDMSDVAKAGS